MFSSFFRNYFGFNKQQRNGLFILLCISATLLIIRLVYPYFIGPDNIQLLSLPLRADTVLSEHLPDHTNDAARKQRRNDPLFSFDPNTVSAKELVLLGFSEKQAAAFIRFRSKGFAFRKTEDLKKPYVVSDYLYQRLAPYVKIAAVDPAPPRIENNKPFVVEPKPVQLNIELNTADSTELTLLPGIGPVLARRILKYRDLLGGFASVNQLREVFGISEELAVRLQNLVSVDPGILKKLHINSDEFKRLSRHPYLGFELTKRIFSERRKNPLTAQDLETLLPDPAAYERLIPYVDFD